MTFTEAAIEVLRREGKPLHFKKIAEIAVRESLLDHVGKIPDDTMADQLVAHCRLPHEDRKVIPILSGTFALVEWGMDEDPTGLDNLLEPVPDSELPYRGRERHPIPLRDLGRGRGERRRREEEGQRPRRFPPPAEVAYEILAGAGRPLGVAEIAAQGAERLLMPDAFVRDIGALRSALLEDNHRRESAGRRGLFQIDGDTVTLVAQPEPGEKPAAPVARGAVTAADARRSGLAALRRRLRECDAATMEHVVCRMLEKLGFKELKVAKRGREHVIYTGRRRLGLADVRHGIRILRSGADVGRRDVTELRRDLGHYGAQIGAVLTAGEAAREARGEAGAPGQLPVLLLCGEALAEAFAEAGVGCVPVVVPEVDEAFFRTAAELAEQEEAARKARREERERREGREDREPREAREERRREGRRDEARAAVQEIEAGAPAAAEGAEKQTEPRILEVAATLPAEAEIAGAVPAALDADAEGDDDEDQGEGEGDEEGGDEAPAAAGAAGEPGQPGERRRRRRRRRRRGGRGRSREGGERDAAAAGGGPEGGGPEGGAKGAAPEGASASTPGEPVPSGPAAPSAGLSSGSEPQE